MIRQKTEGVVLHRTERWTGDDYHIIVQKDGMWDFHVPLHDVAFHACRYNHNTIAVAIFGDFASMEPGLNWHPTPEQIEETIHLVQYLPKEFPSLKWIAGHSQLGVQGTAIPNKLVPGHTCPGENFPLNSIMSKSGLPTLKEYTCAFC